MFRLATSADIGGPAKGMWEQKRTTPYDAIGGTPYSANGYHGNANRSGWANLFGGAERDWQDYEHVRAHQAGKDFEPGVDNLILAGPDGAPAPGRSIVIAGKKWVSGPEGKLRMIDMAYFSKASEAEEQRRNYTPGVVTDRQPNVRKSGWEGLHRLAGRGQEGRGQGGRPAEDVDGHGRARRPVGDPSRH